MELERIIKVTEKNLNALKKQRYSVQTRHGAHLRELVRALSEHTSFMKGDVEELAGIYTHICEALSLSKEDRLSLCCFISEEYRGTDTLVSVMPASRRCRISYVKNPLSDLAYDSFSMFFDKAAVEYADDFVSMLEDVYHSACDYAILPVYSEKGGRLKSFCDLADKYEMKKVMTCRVYSNTEDAETEFALYSKNFERFSSKKQRELFFELCVPYKELVSCLMLADAKGYEVVSCVSDDSKAELCLEIPDGNILPICFCLMLEMPDHEIKGIY